MSNMGLFHWIREGVKQSVLLGVSDAVEVIGAPEEASPYHPALQAFAKAPLQRLDGASSNPLHVPRLAGEPNASRKRLGKSLKDINPPKAVSPKVAPPKSDA